MPGSSERTPESELQQTLAAAIVRLLREYTGRGATRARTIVDTDTIMVLLEDSLTKGEQSLLDRGRHDEVLQMRRAFQETMSAEMTAKVQELTGRRVRAFMSANNLDPDFAAEIFVLGPLLADADPDLAPDAAVAPLR